MGPEDPRRAVEAPVRRELAWLIVRGVALVAVVATLAICPLVLALDVPARDRCAMAAPVVLLAYAGLMAGWRRARDPMPTEARLAAWARAREIDPDDALLGRLVAGWVPVGLLAALTLLVWPHLTDANPALACAWVVIGLPPTAIAWMIASATWLDACRDDLARAERASDALLRHYWANVGR